MRSGSGQAERLTARGEPGTAPLVPGSLSCIGGIRQGKKGFQAGFRDRLPGGQRVRRQTGGLGEYGERAGAAQLCQVLLPGRIGGQKPDIGRRGVQILRIYLTGAHPDGTANP